MHAHAHTYTHTHIHSRARMHTLSHTGGHDDEQSGNVLTGPVLRPPSAGAQPLLEGKEPLYTPDLQKSKEEMVRACVCALRAWGLCGKNVVVGRWRGGGLCLQLVLPCHCLYVDGMCCSHLLFLDFRLRVVPLSAAVQWHRTKCSRCNFITRGTAVLNVTKCCCIVWGGRRRSCEILSHFYLPCAASARSISEFKCGKLC
jgi:hypothetical protein